MLEEQSPRVLVVVRVDEAEHGHHSDRGREKSEDRLPLERSSESMEERDGGGDEEDGEDSDELQRNSEPESSALERKEHDGKERTEPTHVRNNQLSRSFLSNPSRQRNENHKRRSSSLDSKNGRDRASDDVREEGNLSFVLESTSSETDEFVASERDDSPGGEEGEKAA